LSFQCLRPFGPQTKIVSGMHVVVRQLLHQVDGWVTLRYSLSPPAYGHKTHKHITLKCPG
jgi:hypothetical protein